MLEPRRSRYLRALGIDIYVPRVILPGALPSAACEWEELLPEAPTEQSAAAIAALVTEPASEVVPAAARETTADLSRLAGELQAPAQRRGPAEKPAAPVVSRAASTTQHPQFALGIAVGSGILVIDGAPAATGERNEYLRLLGNIQFALRGDGTPAFDVFVWPMLKQPHLDLSAAAARETLAAHIQSLCQRHGVHTILLLGEAAVQWWTPAGAEPRCVASVSALACLRNPALKRQLWDDIRHLAAVH